jgi:hypothetical protein
MSGFTTASFLFKVDTRDAFNRFLDTPEDKLGWLREHGKAPQHLSVLFQAPYEAWVEGGATIDSQGGVGNYETPFFGVPSLKTLLVEAAQRFFIEKGSFESCRQDEGSFHALPEERVIEVLHERARLLRKKEEERERIRMEAEKAEKEEFEAAKHYELERLRWVGENGSERLHKALETGLLGQCDKVYREERLAKEYDGWRWMEKGADDLREIRNPSHEAMTLLEVARSEIDQDAELCWNVRAIPQDDYGAYLEDTPEKYAVIHAQILGHSALFRIR